MLSTEISVDVIWKFSPFIISLESSSAMEQGQLGEFVMNIIAGFA
jgi:hypothetical protein